MNSDVNSASRITEILANTCEENYNISYTFSIAMELMWKAHN
jgi:hypothetical protein